MNEIEKAVINISEMMALAAKTAPKARGEDNLVIKVFKENELDKLADQMETTGKSTKRPDTFKRDASSVRKSFSALVIGTRYSTLNLDCGFCGHPTCESAKSKDITCAYNSGDLGIAVGSACGIASDFHVDNRIMYTLGYTVVKNGLMGDDIRMALGIPRSATSKNPYFDRKP